VKSSSIPPSSAKKSSTTNKPPATKLPAITKESDTPPPSQPQTPLTTSKTLPKTPATPAPVGGSNKPVTVISDSEEEKQSPSKKPKLAPAPGNDGNLKKRKLEEPQDSANKKKASTKK